MTLSLLAFLASFVFLLPLLPFFPPNGTPDDWVSAAWTLTPLGTATLPLPVLLGKTAFFLFPFGTPTFRMNTAGALLAGLSSLLAFRLFRLSPVSPGSVPRTVEEERTWSTVSWLAISLWGISPLFLRMGTAGPASAATVFFPLLTLERWMTWIRTSRNSRGHWIHGFGLAAAGGLTLTLDSRWALVFPILLALRRGKFRQGGGKPLQPRDLIVFGGTGILSFFLPWIVFASFGVATGGQLLRVLPETIAEGLFSKVRFPGGDLSAFLLIGALLLVYALARTFRFYWARFPRGVPLAFFAIFLFELTVLFKRPSAAVLADIQTAQAHRWRGEDFVRLQAPDRAEDEFLTALAMWPEDSASSEKLGRLLLNFGEAPRAAAAFAKAARLGRSSPSLFADWASAEIMSGRILKAVGPLRRALALETGNDALRETLARLFEKTAQPKEAAAEWRILTEHRPKDKEVLWRLILASAAAHEFKQAQGAVQRYLRMDLTEEERQAGVDLKTTLDDKIRSRGKS